MRGMEVIFDLGEQKHVYVEIRSRKGQDFQIRSASWELLQDGKTETGGSCVIIDHVLDIFLYPQQAGIYILRVTYEIADEVLVENIIIKVYKWRTL